jgi:hypothetical protein
MMPVTPAWRRPSCSSSLPCLATSREGAADIEKCIISPLFYIEKSVNFRRDLPIFQVNFCVFCLFFRKVVIQVAYVLGKFHYIFAYALGKFHYIFAYVLGKKSNFAA